MHRRAEHVIDVGVGELLHLAAGRDGQHLLQREHTLGRRNEIDRLVVAVITIDAGIVDDAEPDFAGQEHLFHRAGEVDELDRLELLQRGVGRVEIGLALAEQRAAHHQEGLSQAVDRDDIAAAHAVVLGVPQLLPGADARIALVGADAEADGAGEDRDADDLVTDGVGIDVGDIRHQPGIDPGFDDAHFGRGPLLV